MWVILPETIWRWSRFTWILLIYLKILFLQIFDPIVVTHLWYLEDIMPATLKIYTKSVSWSTFKHLMSLKSKPKYRLSLPFNPFFTKTVYISSAGMMSPPPPHLLTPELWFIQWKESRSNSRGMCARCVDCTLMNSGCNRLDRYTNRGQWDSSWSTEAIWSWITEY